MYNEEYRFDAGIVSDYRNNHMSATIVAERNRIRRGTKVRYIHLEEDSDRYPSLGTRGTVKEVCGQYVLVKWDYGSSGPCFCHMDNVEVISIKED